MISERLNAAIVAEISDLETEKEQIEQRIAGLRALLPEATPAAPRTTQRRRAASQTKQQVARAKDRETRDEAMLRVVRKHGQKGVTIREIANELGLKDATGLYRVAKRLVSQGHLLKTGVYLTPRID